MDLLAVEAEGRARATLILAHGAGAPMDSGFMGLLCGALATKGIATVRFEFPYMARRRREGGKRPPDRQPVLLDRWREVYEQVANDGAAGKLLIGGKSMGGRMASLAAEELRPAGFCCFGYPFFPPGKRDVVRAEHFPATTVPGLILQGTRDAFGKPGEVDTSAWPATIELQWLAEGDHDLKARKRSGLTQEEIIGQAAMAVGSWLARLD